MSTDEDRSLELAELIRALRKDAGLTGVAFAKQIRISQSKVSKMENGKLLPTLEDIDKITDALALSARKRSQLVQLVDTVTTQLDRVQVGSLTSFRTLQNSTAELERKAKRIRVFNPYTLPGLLQTEAFARHLLSRRFDDAAALEEAVQVRINRQQAMADSRKRLVFVLGEAAFRWKVSNLDVMSEQVDHLRKLQRQQNCEIRVLPFAEPVPMIPHGSFAIYDSDLITVESFASGELKLKGQDDVEHFSETFEQFSKAALTGTAAINVMKAALQLW